MASTSCVGDSCLPTLACDLLRERNIEVVSRWNRTRAARIPTRIDTSDPTSAEIRFHMGANLVGNSEIKDRLVTDLQTPRSVQTVHILGANSPIQSETIHRDARSEGIRREGTHQRLGLR